MKHEHLNTFLSIVTEVRTYTLEYMHIHHKPRKSVHANVNILEYPVYVHIE